MPEPDRKNHDAYLNNYNQTGDAQIIGIGRNVTALRESGEHFPMRLSVIEYASQNEVERRFIASCQDISLQKRQEEQLRRSLKMEAIGKLTSGITHDYNNMLCVIYGYTQLLKSELKDEPGLLDHVNEINHAVKRSQDLTEKLLSVSRVKPASQKVAEINGILRGVDKLLNKILTINIKIVMKLQKDLWPAYIDEGSLEEAILNMSINAMHAMPNGGQLEFRTSNDQIDSIESQVVRVKKGSYVNLTVTDSGIGMREDVMSHIFEPFFTTKGEEGTGLGLSQIYNFVTTSGGAIKVESEPGHSTCFSLFFPRFDA